MTAMTTEDSLPCSKVPGCWADARGLLQDYQNPLFIVIHLSYHSPKRLEKQRIAAETSLKEGIAATDNLNMLGIIGMQGIDGNEE